MSGSAGVAPGTITSEPLYDNVNGLLANVELEYAAIYDPDTNVLVLRKTGLSTDEFGVYTFTDPAVLLGINYLHDWLAVDGSRCMPQKAAT